MKHRINLAILIISITLCGFIMHKSIEGTYEMPSDGFSKMMLHFSDGNYFEMKQSDCGHYTYGRGKFIVSSNKLILNYDTVLNKSAFNITTIPREQKDRIKVTLDAEQLKKITSYSDCFLLLYNDSFIEKHRVGFVPFNNKGEATIDLNKYPPFKNIVCVATFMTDGNRIVIPVNKPSLTSSDFFITWKEHYIFYRESESDTLKIKSFNKKALVLDNKDFGKRKLLKVDVEGKEWKDIY